MLTYFLFRLMGFLAPRVPFDWGYRLGERLAGLVYRISPRAEAVRDNMRHVLGPGANPEAMEAAARQVFRTLVLNHYDLFRLPALPVAAIRALIEVEGWEHLEAAMAPGRGVVLVTAHCGNPEVFAHVVASLGVPLTGFFERLKPEVLYRYVHRLRTAHGLRLIPVGGPVLEVFRTLRRGEMVGLVMDRDTTDSGEVLEFFGEPAWLPTGYARLAAQARAPILLAVSHRLPAGRAVARLYPPLFPPAGLSREERTTWFLRQVLPRMERAIAQEPGQWWLTTPIWQIARQRLSR